MKRGFGVTVAGLVGSVGSVAAFAGSAHAGDCRPAVALAGEPAAIDTIADVLAARGIATRAFAKGCPVVHARVVANGDALAITIDGDPDAGPIERTARDPDTAATVIESWARADLGGPLLDARPIAIAEATPAPIAPTPPAAPHDELVASGPPVELRGIQLSVAAEAAVATDRTTWGGVQLGACFGLGPVCVAAKIHLDGVTSSPSTFGNFDRDNKEVLLGLDVPIALGRGGARLVPGASAGIGTMHTHVEEARAGGETGGLRADAHVTLSVPFGARWALEVALAGDLTQATHLETNTMMQLPPEPRGILRLAVGLRYGGL